MELANADLFRSAGLGVLSVLAFRAMPMVAWTSLAPNVSVRARAVAASLGIGLALFLTWSGWPILWWFVLHVYFIAVGCGVRWLAAKLRSGSVTRAAVFALSAAMFVVFPGLLLPLEATVLVAIVGWELMLSAYSYCVEMAGLGTITSVSDCLFFLLVNPALVYPDRGKRLAGTEGGMPGIRRLLLGLVALFVAASFIGQASNHVRAVSDHRAGVLLAVGAAAPLGLLQRYLEHSGVASIQIGVLRQLGYVVPERYVRPFAASGPVEFWRRWNTYVGGWVTRYVFWPASLHLARRSRIESSTAQAVGIVLTFVCVGGLHELSAYFIGTGLIGKSLLVFTASGLLVLVWLAGARVWELAAQRASEAKWLQMSVGILSRTVFWSTAAALFYVWTK